MGQPTLPTPDELTARASDALAACGATDVFDGGPHPARSPITGAELGGVSSPTADVAEAIERSHAAFLSWRSTPAPVRGEVVRALAGLLRDHKEDLATLVQIEAGKIRSEALGEVQEMIDICDFAVGLSRQLHGLSIATERPGHRLAETWHPLGVCGVISAFNFPVAVWSWNAALAIVCGDPVVWKPSDMTPLTAIACNALLRRAAEANDAPADLGQVVLGGREVGAALAADARVPVVSATGSTRMGREIAPVLAARFARAILELGGNNAALVAPSADLDLAVRGIVFSAAGTAGQRCTTLRRLIVHSSIHDEVVEQVARAYESLPVGSPLDAGTLVGPLISPAAGRAMGAALDAAVAQGGTVVAGGGVEMADTGEGAAYRRPALVTMPGQTDIVRTETFAPILYVMSYDEFDQAIEMQNGVPQGLASSIFTTDLREAERFCAYSDCGIANVNIGPSGAEIGGAFGGEKETGGGRESGSDAWKGYMRRATNTVNYSSELPLAQGVQFG